jgi:hypothetical protein
MLNTASQWMRRHWTDDAHLRYATGACPDPMTASDTRHCITAGACLVLGFLSFANNSGKVNAGTFIDFPRHSLTLMNGTHVNIETKFYILSAAAAMKQKLYQTRRVARRKFTRICS